MAAQRFDIFGAGIHSKSRKVTAQKRVNVYYEFEEQDEDTTKVAIFGAPGLELFSSTLGDTPVRGMIAPKKSSVMYAVHRDSFVEINAAGTVTVRGTLTGATGRCYLAENGTQVMVVDPTDSGKGYIYTIATTTLAAIADADYPGLSGVDFVDGFFVGCKLNSGRWYKSASYDGTGWTATDFTNAEMSPDNNVGLVVAHGEVAIFGDTTIEFAGNTGGAGFPFQAIQGVGSEWGLDAVQSVAVLDNAIFALMRQKQGGLRLMKFAQYEPLRVSNDAWEQVIQRYSATGDAVAFSYMMDGHSFYQISFPTEGVTWLYDDNTKMFFERESEGGRHRANLAVGFGSNIIVSDYETGTLYKLRPDVYQDNGAEITRLLRSKHVFDAGALLTVSSLQFLFDAGVGLTTGQGSDPEVMLRYSKDGGNTWSAVRRLKLGAIGEYGKRVMSRNFGQGRDFVFELSMTDPVKFALIGEAIDVVKDEQRAAS
jgi:hypothetical protein